MTATLIGLFAALCIGGMVLAWRSPSGTVQYPFLASAVMLGWAFPQFLGLHVNGMARADTLRDLVLFTALCLIASFSGYAVNRREAELLKWEFSVQRLVVASAVLMLIGGLAYLKVMNLAEDVDQNWTGPITIYFFFASMIVQGLVVALVVHIHFPTRASRAIAFLGVSFLVYRFLALGRREEAVELLTILLLYQWFAYGRTLPKIATMSLLVFGVIFVHTAGTYRTSVVKDQKSAVNETILERVDPRKYATEFVENISNPRSTLEALNAAKLIEASKLTGYHDFGRAMWNYAVRLYVPGQLVGNSVKEDLYVDVRDVSGEALGFTPFVGSTQTGMGGAFRAFGYLGIMYFFATGYIMSRWFRAANSGSPAAQMIVMLITSKALLAITHSNELFFLDFVNICAFLLPALLFARVLSTAVIEREGNLGL